MDNAFATWIQVIASLLSVILALVGLVIARDASREARSNRDFQLDRSVGDEFALAVSALSVAGGQDRPDRSDFARRYGEAVRLWSSRVTSPRAQRQRGELEGFLRKLGHTAERLLPMSSAGRMEPAAHTEYELTLARAQRLTREWAYPEQRRSVLSEVLHNNVGELAEPRSSPHVQVQRWLLVSDPSDSKTVQRVRAARVGWLMLVDDVRRRRLGRTIREWFVSVRLARREMHAYKVGVRAARRPVPPVNDDAPAVQPPPI